MSTAFPRFLGTVLFGVAILWSGGALAIDPRGFEDPEKQARYQTLLEELRCLVCQNESLASSGAGLAGDLRGEVYRLVDEGHDTDQIKTFLVERYGEFVLYRPRMSAATALLWFGPLLLIIAGLIVTVITIRRRSPVAAQATLSEEERDRLEKLLDEKRDGNNNRESAE